MLWGLIQRRPVTSQRWTHQTLAIWRQDGPPTAGPPMPGTGHKQELSPTSLLGQDELNPLLCIGVSVSWQNEAERIAQNMPKKCRGTSAPDDSSPHEPPDTPRSCATGA